MKQIQEVGESGLSAYSKYDAVYEILREALLKIEVQMAGDKDLLDFIVPLTEMMYMTIPQLKAFKELEKEDVQD